MNRERIKCPGCDLQLPAGDLQAQMAHLEGEHSEIIRGRLEDAGFRRGEDGEWIDTLVGAYDCFDTSKLDVEMARPDVGGSWSAHGEAQDFVVDRGEIVATARPETLAWLLQHMLPPYPLFFAGDARWSITHLRMPCHDEPAKLSGEQEIALVAAEFPEEALHPFELDALHEASQFGSHGYTPDEDWNG